MNKKLPNLIEFCQRIGIFSSCTKSNTSAFGPYGQLLLEQIKKQWLRANFSKFENNFIVDSSNNLLKKDHDFNSDFFTQNLVNVFDVHNLPIGLLNVYTSKCKSNKDAAEDHHKLLSEINFLTKKLLIKDENKMLTHLNAFHFYNNEQYDSLLTSDIDVNIMKSDPLAFWQRERKNWWVKIFSFPEYVELERSKNETNNYIDNINIIYKPIDDENSNDINSNCLENVRHITGLNKDNQLLRSILNSTNSESNILLRSTSQMIITQTTVETVLEGVLLDSVQYRRNKNEILNLPESSHNDQKTVFRLDYKLAPFKACIIYNLEEEASEDGHATNSNDSFFKQARDLKRIFSYNQIDVFLMPVKSESELQNKYDRLDEMGVPYSIYLPSSLAKDGICFVRNRDTTLQEHLHISLIVKQFRSISNALCF